MRATLASEGLKKLREYCGNVIIPCIERVFTEKEW